MNKKYCSHCCTITDKDECSKCQNKDLREILINVQKGRFNEAR